MFSWRAADEAEKDREESMVLQRAGEDRSRLTAMAMAIAVLLSVCVFTLCKENQATKFALIVDSLLCECVLYLGE